MLGIRLGAAVLVVALLTNAMPVNAQSSATVPLGVSNNSVAELTAAGAPPTYASYWVGEWMATSGWGGLENMLRSAKSAGTTPVLFWYYWGDSISPSCVENGCNSRNKAEWNSLTTTLASKIDGIMGGAPVFVVLENEFNKGGITDPSYAPTFDGYLEDKANELKAVDGVQIVLGYGSWGESAWDRFPKAIAASDMIGFQIMRASTDPSHRSDAMEYYRAAPDKIASVLAHIRSISPGKDALLYDLALSSYPDDAWLKTQDEVLAAIMARRAEYAEDGLRGMVYREIRDNPSMSPSNYFGYAEQHWGFKTRDGVAKPSYDTWLAAASGSTPPPPPPPPPAPSVPAAFEGELMTATKGGRESDASASGGAVWNLWSNGQLSQRVASDGTSYRATIVARGSLAAGIEPRMELRVNGASVAAWNVPAGALREFAADLTLPAGESTIAIAFTNDALANGEDRNLYVDLVRVAAPDRAPTASFSHDVAGMTVGVDGSTSSDPEGQALSYAWAFGDGTSASGPRATHTYANDGTYTIALTVSDGTSTSTATRDVTVIRPNAAPAASFVVAGSHLAWSFDARGSSDPDGDALAFQWDLGDGASATGAQASHEYAPGTYLVTLTVTDARGLSSTAQETIVAVAPNRAPSAAFSASGPHLTWTYDASSSIDPDGDDLSYAWDLGDGRTATGRVVSATYASAGERLVRLVVTDTHGASAETHMTVQPTAPPPPPAGRERQAEAFATKDNGKAFSDANAQEGLAWLLWANGAMAQPFQPGAGTYRVEIVARGDVAANVWPAMELRADGVKVAQWTVSSTSWRTYTAEISFASGQVKTLEIAFTNDAVVNGQDRNLRVDALRLVPPPPRPIVFEGESFPKIDNGKVFTDASASGGKAWLLWSNGAMSQPVTLQPGKWNVEILAKGDHAGGAQPRMELRTASGTLLGTWDVGKDWSTYRASVTLPAQETLQISFVNDYNGPLGDRNLRIDAMRLVLA